MSAVQGAQKSSNFYLGFLFLDKERRAALSAVYAFARAVDDVADDGSLTKEEASRRLDAWSEEVGRLFAGKPNDPIAKEIAPFIERFDLPREGFDALIKGVRMDLERSRYETFDELKEYLFGVAGAVGLLCVRIFGYSHTPPERIRAYAVAMGNAFQLTNILRDVGEDLERGRIYLPLEDIRASGVSLDDILRRRHTPQFQALMELEYRRAKSYYREARSLLHPHDRPAMTPAEVMAHVYEDVLERVRESGYRVFFRRARVPSWRKAALAASAWLYCRGVF